MHVAAAIQKTLIVSGALLSAVMARFFAHAEIMRANNEPFFTKRLVFETVAAIFCGLVAMGVSDYFALSQAGTCALCGVSGYLGPKGLVELVLRFVPVRK